MGSFFGFAPIVTRVVPILTYAGGAVLPVHGLESEHVFSTDHQQTARVWGFSVSNTSAGTVVATVRTDLLSTQIWAASIPANSTIIVPIPFIADFSLAVTTSVASALSFTFWHSQTGA